MRSFSTGCARSTRSGRGWTRSRCTPRRWSAWRSCCFRAAPPPPTITTCFRAGTSELIDAEIAAARRIGIRFHPTRGSMSVGRSKGGLPPDSVVQSEDRILADCERVIRKYHDPAPGSMLRIALAPCSPFSVSPRLMRETADLASRHGVRLHTHLAETRDEEAYCLERFGKRPLDLLRRRRLARRRHLAGARHLFQSRRDRAPGPRGRGDRALSHVEHAAGIGMRAGAGAAPGRVPGGLGVDGSASNDSSHMLAEARQALLLQRLRARRGRARRQRCLADGHGGGRALPGPRRYRHAGAGKARRHRHVRPAGARLQRRRRCASPRCCCARRRG